MNASLHEWRMLLVSRMMMPPFAAAPPAHMYYDHIGDTASAAAAPDSIHSFSQQGTGKQQRGRAGEDEDSSGNCISIYIPPPKKSKTNTSSSSQESAPLRPPLVVPSKNTMIDNEEQQRAQIKIIRRQQLWLAQKEEMEAKSSAKELTTKMTLPSFSDFFRGSNYRSTTTSDVDQCTVEEQVAKVAAASSSDQENKTAAEEVVVDKNPYKVKHWDMAFSKIETFCAKHGHCNVTDKEDVSLYAWCDNQKQKRKASRLNDEEIALLDSIGFNWDLKLNRYTTRRWHGSFQKLEEFQNKHGHCEATEKVAESALSAWVRKQKERRRTQKLDNDQIRRLDSLGFDWGT